MGCASSKFFTRSGSFKEEVRHSLQRVSGLEEVLASKNGGDQFLALLCTANTVARKLKAGTPTQEPGADTNAPLEPIDSNTSTLKVELTNIETINTRELLAGLEEDNKDERQENPQQLQSFEATSTEGLPSTGFKTTEEYKFIVNNESVPSTISQSSKEKPEDGVVGTRRFCFVEEYDTMVARNHSVEEGKFAAEGSESSIKDSTTFSDHPDKVEGGEFEQEWEHVVLEPESIDTKASAKEIVILGSDLMSEKGSRRKSMAKKLAAFIVPGFELSKSASLRDWLLQGGQVLSPGSQDTPKFGDFVPPVAKDGDTRRDDIVFDPEMVTHFEQAMKQLAMEEECILTQIVESLRGSNDEGISSISNTTGHTNV